MTKPLELDLDLPDEALDNDNITDWCLTQFQTRYGDHINKDAIWEYLYGVMHAPDWRTRYKHDLQRNLPRVPFADDFEAFCAAGRELMNLHINYETCDEYPLTCLVDGKPDEGNADADAYRIERKMRWAKAGRQTDRSILEINHRCKLIDIPDQAHDYTVSGRTPLDWAIDSLRLKYDKDSRITDDPNHWHAWAEEPYNLIRHLQRLVYLSVETSRIVNNLPASLSD